MTTIYATAVLARMAAALPRVIAFFVPNSRQVTASDTESFCAIICPARVIPTMLFLPFPAAVNAAIDLAYKHQLGLMEGRPSTEILICLSNDGTYVIDASVGEPDKVQLTEKMLNAASSAEGCCLVHNHPKRGSLSAADWRLAVQHSGIHEIIAVNYRKSIFRGVPNRGKSAAFSDVIQGSDLSVQIGADVLQTVWDQFKLNLSRGLETEDPTCLEKELDWVWSHLFNEHLQAKCYVTYCADLSSDDNNELINPRLVDFVRAGRAKAATLIL